MPRFDIEWTDTFNGEANYCWADRSTIEATSLLDAARKAKQARYRSPVPRDKRSNYGDALRLDIVGAWVVCFVTWHDDSLDAAP